MMSVSYDVICVHPCCSSYDACVHPSCASYDVCVPLTSSSSSSTPSLSFGFRKTT